MQTEETAPRPERLVPWDVFLTRRDHDASLGPSFLSVCGANSLVHFLVTQLKRHTEQSDVKGKNEGLVLVGSPLRVAPPF